MPGISSYMQASSLEAVKCTLMLTMTRQRRKLCGKGLQNASRQQLSVCLIDSWILL